MDWIWMICWNNFRYISAPLNALISELEIPIAVRLENPHIIDESQICVKIVSTGPDKESLNSSYQNRDNPKYLSSLARTILSFCSVVSHGLLVFFPSYYTMNKSIEFWKQNGKNHSSEYIMVTWLFFYIVFFRPLESNFKFKTNFCGK